MCPPRGNLCGNPCGNPRGYRLAPGRGRFSLGFTGPAGVVPRRLRCGTVGWKLNLARWVAELRELRPYWARQEQAQEDWELTQALARLLRLANSYSLFAGWGGQFLFQPFVSRTGAAPAEL